VTSNATTRHQVFVSSTYIDLVEERRAVIQALLELDCIPAGMEMFPAADDDQWTLIREVIDISDYYIVIVGGRYGSTSAAGISFTEMEYDYAVANGIPVLGFVHGDPASIPAGRSELDAEARDRLEAFRSKVMQRMVKQFKSPDELASVVSRGLVRAIRTQQRPGWVRGDQAMTDTVRAEIAELRAALAERERAELVHRAAGSEIDDSFEHGDDRIALTFVVSQAAYGLAPVPLELEYSWDDLVAQLGPFMIDEASEPTLRGVLCQHAGSRFDIGSPESWRRLISPSVTIDDASWGTVVVQLRALSIIETGTKRRAVSDQAVYWKLTPAGDNYLVRLKARKRVE